MKKGCSDTKYCKQLLAKGFKVNVESSAGEASAFQNSDYELQVLPSNLPQVIGIHGNKFPSSGEINHFTEPETKCCLPVKS